MLGIIGAMEKEVELLRAAMKNANIQKIGGYEFITGRLNGKDVVLLQCGIGKVAAAVGCAILIHQYKPAFVINTGSAGGIHSNLKVGDVIISDGLVYHDVDVTAFNYAPGQIPGQPQIFKADSKLIALAEGAVNELKNEGALPGAFNFCRGIIGTGDIFMHDPEKISAMKAVFPDVLAVEMEGAAVAHACVLFSIPFIVIRAVSDVAGSESPVSFKEFLEIASDISANIVKKIIK